LGHGRADAAGGPCDESKRSVSHASTVNAWADRPLIGPDRRSPGCHLPIRPPSFFHTATIAGRAGESPPSGQRESGSSAFPTPPGCCTATSATSSVTTGPHASAPIGTVKNCLTLPLSRPSTGTENKPSFEPSALPSVEIHRLP